MFVVAPSPKLQFRFVIVPLEVSVNVTSNGATPLVGVALNNATGTTAPLPVTALVAAPPLAVAKSTLLVNPPAATGANRTVTLVQPATVTVPVPPGATVYGLPAVTANGAAPLAVPLNVWPPVLITEKFWLLVCPTVSVPKLRLAGATANCGGLTATIRLFCVLVATPTGPLTISRTGLVPAG